MSMPIAHSTSQMSPIRQCRIAIVDGKPRLHGRIASLLHRQSSARGFLSIDSLLARDDHAPMVVVVGPTMMSQESLEEFGWLLEKRPDTALVLAAMRPTRPLMEWALETGVADIIDLATEADKLGDAVDMTARILSGEEIPEEEAFYEEETVPEPVAMQMPAPRPMTPEAPVREMPHPRDPMPRRMPPPQQFREEVTQEHQFQMPHGENERAEIITVFSTKGGAGKSVVASNLAVKLAQHSDRPVVLLDADFQFGDLAIMLKLQPEHSLADAALFIDRFDTEMLQNMLIRHEPSGVMLLASPSVPVVGDFISADDMMRIMDVILKYAGHVVVDTQAHIDEATLAILRMSDEIVLVGSMDIPSVKDMKTGLHLLRSLNVPVENARLVLNRANSKADLDAKQIERSLHHRVDAMVSSDQLIPQSINRRKPAVLDQPNSQFSKSMDVLVELLEKAH